MIAFIFTPLGRGLLIAALILAVLGGIYVKGRSEGAAALTSKLQTENAHVIERANKSRLAADRRNTDPSGLRKTDGYRRD